jgi:hypothetical protein
MARNLRHNRFRLPLQRRSAGVARLSTVSVGKMTSTATRLADGRFCSLGGLQGQVLFRARVNVYPLHKPLNRK